MAQASKFERKMPRSAVSVAHPCSMLLWLVKQRCKCHSVFFSPAVVIVVVVVVVVVMLLLVVVVVVMVAVSCHDGGG